MTFAVVVEPDYPPSRRVKGTCTSCGNGTGWTTRAAAFRWVSNHRCVDELRRSA